MNPAKKTSTSIILTKPDKSQAPFWENLVLGVAVTVALLALAVLFGWYTDRQILIQILPQFVPMQYNTALCFLLLAVGLLMLRFPKGPFPALSVLLGFSVSLIGLLTLIQYGFDQNFGLDELFMKAYLTVKTSHPGRMAPNTAASFFLLGMALIGLSRPHLLKGRSIPFSLLYLAVFVLGFMALFGYMFDIEIAYGWQRYTRMALHTSVCFMLLGLGCFVWVFRKEKNLVMLIAVLTGGIALSLFIFTMIVSANEQQMKIRFEHDAKERITALQREIESGNTGVVIMKAFYDGSKFVDRQEFRNFAGAILKQKASIDDLQWIPYVDEAERAAVEKEARADIEGYQIFQLMEQEPGKKQAPQNFHFPILYLESQKPSHRVPGFDYAADESMLQAFRHAAKSRKIIMLESDHIVPGKRDLKEKGFSLITPVFLKEGDLRERAPEFEGLMGFMIGSFRLRTLFEQSLFYMNSEGIDIFVFDADQPRDNQYLYLQSGGTLFPSENTSLKRVEETMGMGYSEMLEFAGRRWVIICTASSPYYNRAVGGLPWLLLTICLLFTALLMHYLYMTTRARDELVDLTGKLKDEISERKREIFNRKRIEEQLKHAHNQALEASRAKTEFLATMSHEIRTPMNAILGMADLLSESELDKEQAEYAVVLRRSGDALLDLINDILDLSKVESGLLELEETEFQMVSFIERTMEFLAVRAHQKGLELNYHIEPQLNTVWYGDYGRLRQIIVNLIGNAIKFTRKGEIFLSVSHATEGKETTDGKTLVQFMVKDTGIGISATKMAKIFEPFSQADSSMTREYGGTGLGLSICRKLLKLMGGRIWLESREREGSRFYFTLPLRRGVPQTDEDRHLLTELAEKRVLIVDDTDTNRFVLREYLKQWGMKIMEAPDGQSAIDDLRRSTQGDTPIDLILLDCRMPRKGGFDVMHEIREVLALKTPVVVMLTSDHRTGDIARAKEMGFETYLVKPIKKNDLLKAMHQTLLQSPEAHPEEPLPKPVTPMTEERRSRILLVEDSDDNRLLIQSYFKKTPFDLDMAENGEVGVQKFRENPYDLVLMDIHMPVMDGFKATLAIRKLEREKDPALHTPILALSANAFKEDFDKSIAAGCDDHLAKPIKKAVLLEAIGRHLKKALP